MKCTNCGAEIKQAEGKRERRFCDSTCRSGYWQKQKRASNVKKEYVPLPKDYVPSIRIAAIDVLGNKKPLVNKLTPEVKVEFKPKTLAELKAKCPKGFDVFDKAKWIQDNRLKYGI